MADWLNLTYYLNGTEMSENAEMTATIPVIGNIVILNNIEQMMIFSKCQLSLVQDTCSAQQASCKEPSMRRLQCDPSGNILEWLGFLRDTLAKD